MSGTCEECAPTLAARKRHVDQQINNMWCARNPEAVLSNWAGLDSEDRLGYLSYAGTDTRREDCGHSSCGLLYCGYSPQVPGLKLSCGLAENRKLRGVLTY